MPPGIAVYMEEPAPSSLQSQAELVSSVGSRRAAGSGTPPEGALAFPSKTNNAV